MLPNFVIIGAQKAGSSYLMRSLAAHPDVFMPVREIAYFEDPDYEQKSFAWFESHFERAGHRRAVGFKRPSLLGRAECALRLRELVPDVRVIATLRNPIERAVSSYFHLMKNGLIPVEPIEHGLRAILDGRRATQWPMARTVITWGLYHEHLSRWFKYFSRAQFHIVIYDDLQDDRRQTVRRVYEFLDIEPSFEATDIPEIANPSVYSMARQRILCWMRPLQSRLTRDRASVVPHGGLIGSRLRNLSKAFDSAVLARAFTAKRPSLSSELHERLADQFRADVSSLEGLLHRDLSHWMRSE